MNTRKWQSVSQILSYGQRFFNRQSQPLRGQFNDKHLTLCQYAINGSVKDLTTFSAELDPDTFQTMLITPANMGYTPLHISAAHNTSDVTHFFVKALGTKANVIAKQIAHDGNLPIALLHSNPHASDELEIKEHLEILLAPTTQHDIPHLNAPIEFDTVMSRYPELDSNSALYRNLTAAIAAANITRRHIKVTNTHVSTNIMTSNERLTLGNKIEAMRDHYLQEQNKLWFWQKTSKKNKALLAKISLEDNAGNCDEYSQATAVELKKMDLKTPIEVFHCEDNMKQIHIFNVIGRHYFSDQALYKTWGKDAVVCDAQNGLVFLAREIPLYLKSWQHLWLNKGAISLGNVSIAYNPHYHSLQSYLRIYPRLSLFKSDNTAAIPNPVAGTALPSFSK